MKIRHFEHQDAYRFFLTFENGEIRDTDLLDLIGKHVAMDSLHTAHIADAIGMQKTLNI